MKKEFFISECAKFSLATLDYEEKQFLQGKRNNKRWESGPACEGTPTNPAVFITSWEIGGKRGGNYGDGVAESYTVSNPELELDGLIDFLEAYFPDITALQLLRVKQKVIYETFEDNEFYGNNTQYQSKQLSFEDLWVVFQEKGLIPKEEAK